MALNPVTKRGTGQFTILKNVLTHILHIHNVASFIFPLVCRSIGDSCHEDRQPGATFDLRESQPSLSVARRVLRVQEEVRATTLSEIRIPNYGDLAAGHREGRGCGYLLQQGDRPNSQLAGEQLSAFPNEANTLYCTCRVYIYMKGRLRLT